MIKSISLSWLARTDLANFNGGEGAGNLTELKLYDGGRKPYNSGQAVRHALFDTIQRHHPEHFRCSPETPCTDVERCWSCDLRGFLSPEEGKGGTRRWSPVKATPALGQLPDEIVSDLLTRHSDVTKEGRESKDQRVAYVQMMMNTFKLCLVIDVENVGRVQEAKIEKVGKKEKVVGWEERVNISRGERVKRIHALLDGVYHLSGFAKQARAAGSLAPELLLVGLKETYNQRGLNALDLNDEGKVNVEQLAVLLKEHQLLGDRLHVGWTPGVVTNEGEVKEVFKEFKVPIVSVLEAIHWAKQEVDQ